MLWSSVWVAIGAVVFFVRKQQLSKEGVSLKELTQHVPSEDK
jgi:hypothetical protein